MDSTESDRQLIESILREYARIPYAHGDVQIQTVFDREQDHYLLMLVGWDGIRREHGCLVQVDIIGGKFWIQRDGTERGIAQELLDAGVPKDRIVLAFRSPAKRQLTDFAVT
ncbi:MAG: XisI protein [Isosphaeraceae bacterium]